MPLSFRDDGNENHRAQTHCLFCGPQVNERGDPIEEDRRREEREIIARLAAWFVANPITFACLMLRIYYQSYSLEQLAAKLAPIIKRRISKVAVQQRLDHVAMHHHVLRPILTPRWKYTPRKDGADYIERRAGYDDPFKMANGTQMSEALANA